MKNNKVMTINIDVMGQVKGMGRELAYLRKFLELKKMTSSSGKMSQDK